jgi:nitroimidazol reductase NimA-like FMN-containing flavoprotein (pyridoxamine 5'-phosphate oxidase superfamily)
MQSVEGASILVQNLQRQECLDFLKQIGFGRLGCAHDNQPYVVPIYFAYESEQLFGFSTEGQKIEWMRENPLVCVLADDIKSEQESTSVLLMGRYEELPDNPQYAALRLRGHELLEKRSLWWRLAIASSQTRDEHLRVLPVVYRIQIEEITGHRVSADQESQEDAFANHVKPRVQPLIPSR